MRKMVKDIELSKYSVEELNTLAGLLQKEIARKKKNQIQEARNQMEKIADEIGMSARDVLNYNSKKKKPSKMTGKAKFRNPADPEQTWTGRGKRPRWLQEKLDKGAKLEDFAIA